MARLKNDRFFVSVFLVVIMLSFLAYAQSVPYSIRGTVYELDGFTQVPAGTFFSVHDTTNGFYIEGVTGRGSNSGAYAVVVDGNYGDNIVITASNGYNNATRTVTLSGVMSNVDLLLDTFIPNSPPKINSQPITEGIEDSSYSYQVLASDANDDNIIYSLIVKPVGMIISSSGLISWIPDDNDVGPNPIRVQVSDGTDTATQEFTIEVLEVNDPPIIISGPITSAIEDQLYNYDVNAEDVDSEVLEYSLVTSPSGMEIDSVSGLISWIPTNDQVGLNDVEVRVTDGELSAFQNFSINVANVNDAPIIVSVPVTSAIEDEPYVYNVEADDIDIGDTITFSLVTSPSGMEIDSVSGLISWIPTNDQVGLNDVEVRVTDGQESNYQSFQINVANVNDAPIITSDPVTEAIPNLLYEYDVNASDIDNDTLVYGLGTKPSGMEIDFISGLISWVPTNKQIGTHYVTVEVSDNNITVIQEFNLSVTHSPTIGTDTGYSFKKKYFARGISREIIPIIDDSGTVLNITSSIDKVGLSIEVKTLPSQPKDVSKALKKLVYDYLSIEPNTNTDIVQGSFKVSFKVEKDWLRDHDIPSEVIVLARYKENWYDLPTKILGEDNSYFYYEALTPGFSYFAITIANSFVQKDLYEENTDENNMKDKKTRTLGKITGYSIGMPFLVAGTVYDSDGVTQLKGISVFILNLNNNNSFKGITGQANMPGRFSTLITGNLNDPLILRLEGKDYSTEYKFVLGDDLKDLNFKMSKDGFLIFKKKKSLSFNYWTFFIFGFLFVIITIFIKTRRLQRYIIKLKKRLR